MSTLAALNFQNGASPLMEQLIFFHDHSMTILILIITIVSFNLFSTCTNSNIDQHMLESQPLELFWTIIPSFILIFIGLPSIRLLYLLDEVYQPSITIKTMGHQWYWSYEYSDFMNLEFDSYMIPSTDLTNESFRLLDVDNRTVIPYHTQIRTLISAADVLHSWTVPALGVKADAVPGRLNQVNFYSNRPGLFFGQCSEICGANHSFMPISIESVPPYIFINWVKKMINS
uniref:Cytochrome c oxidase subunit 2 n=1 Tax=Orchesella villosa TaxID=48706 RepID=Q37584_ORCVL|nr:cytochrome c oxidase subunit II [Orchesella villosa]ABS57580.1 cytochrome c oxidase subunit II [Orchesella villosa]CAA65040.1 Cytochrome oxidase II [Orchesella villosa]